MKNFALGAAVFVIKVEEVISDLGVIDDAVGHAGSKLGTASGNDDVLRIGQLEHRYPDTALYNMHKGSGGTGRNTLVALMNVFHGPNARMLRNARRLAGSLAATLDKADFTPSPIATPKTVFPTTMFAYSLAAAWPLLIKAQLASLGKRFAGSTVVARSAAFNPD